MRHQRLRRKLSVKTHHRKALLRNLVRNLVIHRRIRTTFAKAKEASSFADTLVTLAKRGDLHARRLLVAKLGCPTTANALITRVAPEFKSTPGGYTRVLRLGWRPGDGGEMALLEFSNFIEVEKVKKPKKEKKAQSTPKTAEAEKPKKEKAKPEAKETKKPSPKQEKTEPEKKEEKKESEKKGGFLGALRKFLKGDE